jgi:hypothetical protein
MSRRPKINHLERLGLLPHPLKAKCKDGSTRTDVLILGRRSRKEWSCASGTECNVSLPIDVDEIYVEHAEGVGRFDGQTSRYHIACAITKEIVELSANAVEQNNGRRKAIAEQKARRAALNAN